MEAITIVGYTAEWMRQHKVDACVLWLGTEAESVMEAARSSPSNRQIVIPGVAEAPNGRMRFSKYAINAVFSEPVRGRLRWDYSAPPEMLAHYMARSKEFSLGDVHQLWRKTGRRNTVGGFLRPAGHCRTKTSFRLRFDTLAERRETL